MIYPSANVLFMGREDDRSWITTFPAALWRRICSFSDDIAEFASLPSLTICLSFRDFLIQPNTKLIIPIRPIRLQESLHHRYVKRQYLHRLIWPSSNTHDLYVWVFHVYMQLHKDDANKASERVWSIATGTTAPNTIINVLCKSRLWPCLGINTYTKWATNRCKKASCIMRQ